MANLVINKYIFFERGSVGMTQKEKITLLKSTIMFMYEKEGRSKSYISRVLEVDRKTLTGMINEWGLIQANVSRLTPSNQKFANKHRQLIKSRLDNNISQVKIAEELGVGRDYLRNIIVKDEVLNKANKDYTHRIMVRAKENRQKAMDKSSLNYSFEELDGEEWKEILGYEGYYISNMGRVKHYIKRYKKFILLKPSPNSKNEGRLYIRIKDKNLQVSRLVGFAFIEGHTKEKNTIDHLDGDATNNRADNLEWTTQGENNERAYRNGRTVNVAYSKNGRFKKIILDGKYEFSTITALAKFLGVSHTQMQRYISGEAKFSHDIEFIY